MQCFSALNHRARGARLITTLSLSTLCLFLAACGSLPVLPAPQNENDTLLVMTTGQHIDVKSDYLYVLEVQIDTMEEPVVIRPWEKYTVIRGLTPGDHMTTTLTIIPYSGSPSWTVKGSNRPKPQPFAVPFVMKPGTCTIFPIRFVYIMKVDAGMGTGMVYWDTEMLSPEDGRKEAENLKNAKNFSLWRIE